MKKLFSRNTLPLMWFSAGIFLAVYALPSSWPVYPGVGLAALGLLLRLLRKPRCRVVSRALLPLGAALLVFSLYACTVTLPANGYIGTAQTADMTAVSYSYPYGYSKAVRVQLAEKPRIRAILILPEDSPDIVPGDRLTAEASFSPPVSGNNADYYPGIGVQLFASCQGDPTIQSGSFSLRYVPVYLAKRLNTLADALFPQEALPILKALVLGDKSLLNRDRPLKTALSRSGLSHITAVSGMHVSFLAGMLAFLIPGALSTAVSAAAVVLFAAVTGFSPGVVRAAVMFLFMLLGRVGKRWNDAPFALFFALALLLTVNPLAAKSVSLQLSFAATLGLLLFSGRFSAALRGTKVMKWVRSVKGAGAWPMKKAAGFITKTLSGTMAALSLSLPLCAIYFVSVCVLSPLSNLLAVWSAAAAFALGMLSLLTGLIWLPLGKALGTLASLPALHLKGTATWIGTMNLATAEMVPAYTALWLAGTYLLAALWLLHGEKQGKGHVPVLMSVTLLLVCLLLNCFESDGAAVTALDVGQGSCTILSCPGGVMVVDCGGTMSSSPGELAAAQVRQLGYSKIDVLVFTHAHSDHTNGAQVLFSQIQVDTVLLPQRDDDNTKELVSLIPGQTQILYVSNETEISIGGMQVHIYPPVGEEENESCLSLVASYRDFDTMLTGDMSKDGEWALMQSYPLADIDLLIAGHHGARTSNCATFLETTAPENAIISVGAGNRYDHPHQETLDRLDKINCSVYRTDLCGTVTITIPKERK